MVLEVMFSGIGADAAVGDGEMAFTIVLWGRGRRKKGKGARSAWPRKGRRRQSMRGALLKPKRH